MTKVTVSKIRPVSWKVSIQSKEDADYVRQVLRGAGIDVTDAKPEPTLMDPPIYAFLATNSGDVPMTTEELTAILAHDERIEIAFESG